MLGLPRSTGQIFGLLYLSPRALSLDDIADLLTISKASASTGTRTLLGWQAVKQVWIPGDRRDHFEAVGDLRELLRAAYQNFFVPKLDKSGRKLDNLLAVLEADRAGGVLTQEDYQFCHGRLEQIGKVQNRIRTLLPLAQKIL